MSQRCLSSSDYQNNFNLSYSVSKLELQEQSMVYPGSSFYVPPSQSSPSNCYYDSNAGVHQQYIQKNSPNSTLMSSSSTPPPSSSTTGSITPSTMMIQEPPMLVASSSSTTTASTMSSSSVEFLNEAFAKATALPESFYPEFLQYSKEAYEQSTGGPSRKKQKRVQSNEDNNKSNSSNTSSSQQHNNNNNNTSTTTTNNDNQNDLNMNDDSENDEESNASSSSGLTSAELRRQIHIQSEQKRRAQIKDGFEELRNELPTCLNKKMSKVALLHRTVQHIQHLKDTQVSILSELERLVHENEQLRKFQESVLQKQALENMYTMANM